MISYEAIIAVITVIRRFIAEIIAKIILRFAISVWMRGGMKMTNFEKIKEMTTEGVADYLRYTVCECYSSCYKCPFGFLKSDDWGGNCAAGEFADWLESEVEV